MKYLYHEKKDCAILFTRYICRNIKDEIAIISCVNHYVVHLPDLNKNRIQYIVLCKFDRLKNHSCVIV